MRNRTRNCTIAVGPAVAVLVLLAAAPPAPASSYFVAKGAFAATAPQGATAVVAEQGGFEQLAGTWRRDDSRGDRNYWMGEYPDMTLMIRVEEDVVVIRQTLGSVRDGVALPGSGEELHEYALTLDGAEHEIATPNASRRRGIARWEAGALRVDSTWTMGSDDPVIVQIEETWSVVDGGDSLQIHRFVEVEGRGRREATVVFSRVD